MSEFKRSSTIYRPVDDGYGEENIASEEKEPSGADGEDCDVWENALDSLKIYASQHALPLLDNPAGPSSGGYPDHSLQAEDKIAKNWQQFLHQNS